MYENFNCGLCGKKMDLDDMYDTHLKDKGEMIVCGNCYDPDLDVSICGNCGIIIGVMDTVNQPNRECIYCPKNKCNIKYCKLQSKGYCNYNDPIKKCVFD